MTAEINRREATLCSANLVSTTGSVPEPSTFALLCVGLAALGLASARERWPLGGRCLRHCKARDATGHSPWDHDPI